MRQLDPDIKEKLEEFNQKVGHAFVRELYNLNRFLRNQLQCDKIPIHTMYQLSLFCELDNGECSNLTVDELAAKESLNKRTAYNYKKRYYEHRQFNIKMNNTHRLK